MLSNLALYYLNQMGITPWITRERLPAVPGSIEQHRVKLIVLTLPQPNDKAELFLQRMLNYVNVPEHELLIIKMADFYHDVEQLSIQLQRVSPLAVLSLGEGLIDLLTELELNCPVLESLDPTYLLGNPQCKKRLFHDLNQIKALLC